MTPRAATLVAMHVENLYDLDPRGRIARPRETGNDFVPRFVLVRSRAGHRWLAGPEVPGPVVAELGAVAGREPRALTPLPFAARELRRLLGDPADADAVAGPAYVLPDALPDPGDAIEIEPDQLGMLARHFPATAELYEERRPVVGIVADGAVVARCCSARAPSAGVEASVDTVEGYRRRGYAVQVTAGWARAVRRLGRVPLYSTEWTNAASLAAARRLGAVRYGVFYEIA